MSHHDSSPRVPWTRSHIHDYIVEAKALVSDEEEPYKTAAFQAILSQLLSGKSTTDSAKEVVEEEKNESAKIVMPEDLVNYVSGLGDPDKIPILWSMSGQEWMKVDDFLSAAADAGMTIAKSWSPKQGGEFQQQALPGKKIVCEKR